MIKVLGYEHVSWCVADTARPAEILNLFGLKEGETESLPGQGVVSTYYEGPNDVRFELIRPSGDKSHLHNFLKVRGPGLHHVCFQVENLEQACKEIKNAGGELVGKPFEDSRGWHAFVHPKSTGGVLIGMIQLHPGLK
jgi:methylmalonyl-CoA/ethylmalonyl-CoA epimerase